MYLAFSPAESFSNFPAFSFDPLTHTLDRQIEKSPFNHLVETNAICEERHSLKIIKKERRKERREGGTRSSKSENGAGDALSFCRTELQFKQSLKIKIILKNDVFA